MRYLPAIALMVCQAASAELCDGKYAASAELVNQTLAPYDTLYSGGDHWHHLDSVAYTTDLYRLWRDLPDWHLRELRVDNDFYPNPLSFDQAQAFAWVGTAADGTAWTPEQKAQAVVYLDLSAVPSKPVGAWLLSTDDRPPFLEWLQFTLEASNAPWAIAHYLDRSTAEQHQPFLKLREAALQRYRNNEGIEWAVVGLLLSPPGNGSAALEATLNRWQRRVDKCTATQAEFAALAVASPAVRAHNPVSADIYSPADFSASVKRLPTAVSRQVLRNIAWDTLLASPAERRKEQTAQLLADVAQQIEDPDFKPWFNVGRTYMASSIEQLTAIHHGQELHGYTFRALNMVSADDLLFFAQHAALPATTHNKLIAVTFARYVAMGRTSQALALIDDLQQATPEHAESISAIVRSSMPVKVQLAAIVLDNPALSTWLIGGYADPAVWVRNSHPRRDLPTELASGVAVQDDFETWMLAPQRWQRLRGMRNYVVDAVDRIYASDGRREWPAEADMPVLIASRPQERSYSYGFQRLIAWDEIFQLASARGLSHEVSVNVIEWARAQSGSWFARLTEPQEPAADLLAKVVRLNRYEAGGELDGVPVGQVAFELLKRRFAKTDAAANTPYWWR